MKVSWGIACHSTCHRLCAKLGTSDVIYYCSQYSQMNMFSILLVCAYLYHNLYHVVIGSHRMCFLHIQPPNQPFKPRYVQNYVLIRRSTPHGLKLLNNGPKIEKRYGIFLTVVIKFLPIFESMIIIFHSSEMLHKIIKNIYIIVSKQRALLM